MYQKKKLSPVKRIEQLLLGICIGRQIASELANDVTSPSPGSFDSRELIRASDGKIKLLSAIVAALHHPKYEAAFQLLLTDLSKIVLTFSRYDQGRYWHLKGFANWKCAADSYLARHSLTHAVELLANERGRPAKGYLTRVFDTFGQISRHEGMLNEARAEFEHALSLRKGDSDSAGTARTHGAIGRVCMDLGDYDSAQSHFKRDLAILDKQASGDNTIRGQLMTEIGRCSIKLGEIEKAEIMLGKGADLAAATGNTAAIAFAALGLGEVALRQSDLATARRQVGKAMRFASQSQPVDLRNELLGLSHKLSAEVFLARNNSGRAIAACVRAKEHLFKSSYASPVKKAELLDYCATVERKARRYEREAVLLIESLEHLDTTTADGLRNSIEEKLNRWRPDLFLRHAVGRIVGGKQSSEILRQTGATGFKGQKKKVVILFSDLRSFTKISTKFPPRQLIFFLNEYLSRMTFCISRFGGMIDKFMGDSVMAVFSLPQTSGQDALRSAKAAMMMRMELTRLNRTHGARFPELSAGIGLHYGEVVAGLIGSPQKRSYTVIGDAVNTASRLEGMTKILGASTLLSGEVVRQFPKGHNFLLRPLGKYSPKGRSKPVTVYDLMGESDESQSAADVRIEIAATTDGVRAFQKSDFKTAWEKFQALAREHAGTGREKGYLLLADKSHEFRTSPPSRSWNKAIILKEK
jgi:class 3 adenylate cyclase